jgi:hypothetical protein
MSDQPATHQNCRRIKNWNALLVAMGPVEIHACGSTGCQEWESKKKGESPKTVTLIILTWEEVPWVPS